MRINRQSRQYKKFEARKKTIIDILNQEAVKTLLVFCFIIFILMLSNV